MSKQFVRKFKLIKNPQGPLFPDIAQAFLELWPNFKANMWDNPLYLGECCLMTTRKRKILQNVNECKIA